MNALEMIAVEIRKSTIAFLAAKHGATVQAIEIGLARDNELLKDQYATLSALAAKEYANAIMARMGK